MPEFQTIIYQRKGRLAYITINRPQRRNAIDHQTSRDLRYAFTDFKEDDKLWVAILTGAGDQAFSAGADLVGMAQELRASNRPLAEIPFADVPFAGITTDFECWKPIIVAINGFCLAGGLELALSCDIRIAAEHATFGLPEPSRGFIPYAGGTQRLPRVIPLSYALELMLTGQHFDAGWALRAGLVSRVVPLPKLLSTAEELAEKIIACGPLAVRAMKKAAYQGLDLPLARAIELEITLAKEIFRTQDAREGPIAFAEKRQPQFKGR